MSRLLPLVVALGLALAAVPGTAAWANDEDDLEEDDLEDEEQPDDLEDDLEADEEGDPQGDEEDDLEGDEESAFGGDAESQVRPGAVDEVVEGTFIARERFFFDGVDDAESRKTTKTSGSLTSSSVFFRELGVNLPVPPVQTPNTNQAPQLEKSQRVFTDLRAQLSAQHIGGSSWYFRGDLRGRFTPGACDASDPARDPTDPTGGIAPAARDACTRFQSGTFGGNELELRELHLSTRGDKTEIYLGRQWVLDLAAHRLDGLQLRYKSSPRVTYIAFGGLHPQKISRDIRQDYPEKFNTDFDPTDMMSAPRTDGRVMPVTGGGGLAYRFEKLYGALGGVLVHSLAEEADDFGGNNQLEEPRLFLTANGYFRQSASLDIYHYAVLDVLGSAAPGITNLTLGINYRPSPRLRTYLQINRVDTETLTAVTQDKLENPQPTDMVDGIQNNIEVLRIAADQARVGLSGSFSMRRYEASTSVAVRRRPEVTLTSPDGGATLLLPAAQDVDVTLRFVDRRSFGGFRLAGQVSKSFGFGEARFRRAETLAVRGSASKDVAEGKGEIEGWVSGVQSTVVAGGDMGTCLALGADQANFDSCFGDGGAKTLTVGALGFYRLSSSVMAVASTSVGYQKIDPSSDSVNPNFSQGSIIPFTAFLRLAYRF